MSDQIKHECGIAQIRLLKPLDYYAKKYGTAAYGLEKLYLLMEKQHNRGQEGAGIACVKLNTEPGNEYIFRERMMGSKAIGDIFQKVHKEMDASAAEGVWETDQPYIGEIYLGHLRYSTTGRTGISYTHPFLRRNNWQSRNLCLAGNFNFTNVDEIFADIVSSGQHPRHNADTFIILEQLGYLLDEQVQGLYERFKAEGKDGAAIISHIEDELDLESIIREASTNWDGGFVIVGSTGSGDSFIFRDKWGIRPAHYYLDDEIFVAASERAVIQTVMNLDTDKVKQLGPGEGIVIKRDGTVRHTQIQKPDHPRPCSFERIYFSRGSDGDIYNERKKLGELLAEPILRAIDYDTDHAVFSFIPNTAEVAYYGMMEGLEAYMNERKAEKLAELVDPTPEQIKKILSHKIRTEKTAVKDIKLRTFIAEGATRNDLAAHVYDITYGTIRPDEDSVVVIDDSIVRGTTLKQSIVRILGRLRPKSIVIVSSSPQVRYPDCYGIDMSRMGEFIAFHAAIELLVESGNRSVIDEVYGKSKAQQGRPKEEIVNYVREIYKPFTQEQVADKIAEMIKPEDCPCEVKVVFQTLEGLHEACPENNGDWYFSGKYPTPGGNRLVNNAFIEFYESRYIRKSSLDSER